MSKLEVDIDQVNREVQSLIEQLGKQGESTVVISFGGVIYKPSSTSLVREDEAAYYKMLNRITGTDRYGRIRPFSKGLIVDCGMSNGELTLLVDRSGPLYVATLHLRQIDVDHHWHGIRNSLSSDALINELISPEAFKNGSHFITGIEDRKGLDWISTMDREGSKWSFQLAPVVSDTTNVKVEQRTQHQVS